jgi:hypothetical protein
MDIELNSLIQRYKLASAADNPPIISLYKLEKMEYAKLISPCDASDFFKLHSVACKFNCKFNGGCSNISKTLMNYFHNNTTHAQWCMLIIGYLRKGFTVTISPIWFAAGDGIERPKYSAVLTHDKLQFILLENISS